MTTLAREDHHQCPPRNPHRRALTATLRSSRPALSSTTSGGRLELVRCRLFEENSRHPLELGDRADALEEAADRAWSPHHRRIQLRRKHYKPTPQCGRARPSTAPRFDRFRRTTHDADRNATPTCGITSVHRVCSRRNPRISAHARRPTGPSTIFARHPSPRKRPGYHHRHVEKWIEAGFGYLVRAPAAGQFETFAERFLDRDGRDASGSPLPHAAGNRRGLGGAASRT